RDQRLDLRADGRLVLAEAGVDQHGGIALRQQVAVGHRKSTRAGRIRADPAVERVRVLQGVELAGGKRRYSAAHGGGFKGFPIRALRQYCHDGTLSSLAREGYGLARVATIPIDADASCVVIRSITCSYGLISHSSR